MVGCSPELLGQGACRAEWNAKLAGVRGKMIDGWWIPKVGSTICRSRELGYLGVCCREYIVMVTGCKMAQYIDILLITSANGK